jgi:hypothetical protein
MVYAQSRQRELVNGESVEIIRRQLPQRIQTYCTVQYPVPVVWWPAPSVNLMTTYTRRRESPSSVL